LTVAFTYVQVTRTYELATDVPATGSVRFRPIDRMVNGLTVVSAPVTAVLDVAGSINVLLAATTDPATRPIGVTYEVREQITGQAVVVYYVSVPHDAPGGTVDLSTLSVISPVDAGAFNIVDAADYDDTTPPAAGEAIVWNATSSRWEPGAGTGSGGVQTVNGEFPDGAGNLVLSASDVGAQPAEADLTSLAGLGDGYPKRASGAWTAQTATQLATDLGVSNTTPVTLTASGGVITPNASLGWLFRYTATANVALAAPTGGTDGQLVTVEVLASGADRVLTFPAGTSPASVTIPSGTWHRVDLRSHGGGTWTVIDPEAGVGVAGGGGGGGIPADGSVTNIKVASNAAISADKLVDGSSNKIMTAAERTKLAAVDSSGVVHAVGNSGSALTLDPTNTGYVKTITLTANCTFTLTGATSGQASTLELVLTQDATGNRTVTWPSSVKWSGAVAPALTTTAAAVDRILLTSYNGGTTWYGDLIGRGYA
jgi:hypothetical protein